MWDYSQFAQSQEKWGGEQYNTHFIWSSRWNNTQKIIIVRLWPQYVLKNVAVNIVRFLKSNNYFKNQALASLKG